MCQCHTTGVAPEFHFVPGELWVSLLYGCPGPHCPQPLGAAPSPGTGGAEGPFPAPLLGKGNPGQPLPPCPGCRGFLEPRWMEQSSLPAPAPLNNGAPTAVWLLMAPGDCLQPGQRGGPWASADGCPIALSPAPTWGSPAGWDASCWQTGTGARPDLALCRQGFSAWGVVQGQGLVQGGTAPVLHPQ